VERDEWQVMGRMVGLLNGRKSLVFLGFSAVTKYTVMDNGPWVDGVPMEQLDNGAKGAIENIG